MALPRLYAFTNTHTLTSGQALPGDIYFSPDTGLITPNYTRSRPEISDHVVRIDLKGEYVVAPGFLECQINGFAGVHFTTLGKKTSADGHGEGERAHEDDDEIKLKKVARALVKTGVTGFLATVPTVPQERWKEILPLLRPRGFPNGATLLGTHVEGPYLAPGKHGAHNPSYFQNPSEVAYTSLYGAENLRSVIKFITLAPELPDSLELIKSLRQSYPHITISLGHSAAGYKTGQAALDAGARCLTHVYNAMNPLHHRDPGLVGLIANNASSSAPQQTISSPTEHLLSSSTSVSDWLARQMGGLNTRQDDDKQSEKRPTARPKNDGQEEDAEEEEYSLPSPHNQVYFTLIPDLIHVHPSTLTLTYRTAPHRAILITDAIELATLPDGTHPANDQICHDQVKKGNKATIANTTTLIGSCITLDHGVRNLIQASQCSLAEAVRCVTENVVNLLCGPRAHAHAYDTNSENPIQGRGRLDIGCRADFVILDRQGHVRQTWIQGKKVYDVDDDTVGED